MKDLFKNENLRAIVVLLILTMQFVLSMTGHRQLETEIVTLAAAAQSCTTEDRATAP